MLTATDNTTQLDISELVDMESEPGCEHPDHPTGRWGHSGPAWALVRRRPACGCKTGTLLVCKGSWDTAGVFGFLCRMCGRTFSRDEGWQLVSVL